VSTETQSTRVKPSDFPRDERFRDPATPPFRDEEGNHHVFSYEDVMRVLLNREDKEPRHDQLRSVVDPWFRTREVRKLDEFIRAMAVDLINGIVREGDGELDLATELAYRFSLRVISSLLGFDIEQEPWLREKLNEFNQAPSFDKLPRQFDVEAFLWEMVAERVAHPRDEMLDTIVDAWKDGRITGRDLLEEVLRFGSVFPTKPLYVLRDSTFGPLTVPEGTVLYVWYAAANRDEAVNGGVEQSSPDVFDIARWPNRHVGLGWGRHFCLGGDLARLETRILLEEALRRLPGLALDETKPFVRFAGIVDGVTEAHFRYDQDAAERVLAEVA
jgi:cytochrome P450